MMRSVLVLLLTLVLAAPAAASDQGSLVVGGNEATPGEWPFMVYLENGRQEVDLGDTQYCGGSLIAPTWVLTAAHCLLLLEITEPTTLVVVAGAHSKRAGDGERIQAKRVIQHPEYEQDGSDLMLVELSRPARGTPLKIAGAGQEPLWATPGTMSTILGWGRTKEGGSTSDVLMEAEVPVVGDAECGAAYSSPSFGFKPSIMVCAGFKEGGVDTCQGDSGGPILVRDLTGAPLQFGVTSFGEGCARENFPGVYAEVGGAELRTFIAEHVPGALGSAGTPPAPAPAQPAPSGSTPPPAQPGSASRSGKPRSKTRTKTRSCKRVRGAKKRRSCCRQKRSAKTRYCRALKKRAAAQRRR